MEYSWDLHDLEECQQKLKVMIDRENDRYRKAYLMSCYDWNQYVLADEAESIDGMEFRTSNSLYCLECNCKVYERFYSIINEFYNIISNTYCEASDLFSFFERETSKSGNIDSLTGANVSKEHCLSLVNEFYQGLDNDLYKKFKDVYVQRKNRLLFTSDLIRKSNNVVYNGYCLFLMGVNENFIKAADSHSIATYYSLVHEYGHAIQGLISPKAFLERYFFEEVASLFPEMVAMYEQRESIYSIDSYYSELAYFKAYFESASTLSMHPMLWQIKRDCEENNWKKFYDDAYCKLGLDRNDVKETIQSNIEDEGIYVLSFTVAIELLNIYKTDKKKALELFKEFLNIDNSRDIWPFVYANFNLNEHVKIEFEEAITGIKKELSLRGIHL